MNLVMDPETHTYRDADTGRVIPSVTQRLQAAGMVPDYGAVNPVVLAHARERGIHVEACCQLWSEGTLDEASVHPEALPYLDAFRRAVERHRITAMRWQVPGYCAEDDTAGTTDIVCDVGGIASVIDVKCVARLSRSYRLQLTAYARMHRAPEPESVNLAPGERWTLTDDLRRYVLHLQKKGTFDLLDCDAEERREGVDDDATWLAVVRVAQWKAVA